LFRQPSTHFGFFNKFLEDCRPGRLLQRIEAHKWAELQPLVNLGTPPPKAAPRAQQKAWSEGFHKRESVFCAQVVRAVHALMRNVQCLGVVVNRVGAARGVFDQLREDNSLEVVLLTGRSRPLDRDTILSKIFPVARAGRERASNGRKLIVVATQCIEVGADFDFDGLVTECASFDALRQRFGRLDRLGKLGTSQAIIVARSDTLDSDPVYGEAIGKTWKWLHKKAKKPRRRSGVASTDALPRIDFGHAYLPKPTEAELKVMVSPSREAPVLLPSHLDAWAMTSPRPAVDPDIGLWLHGVSDEVADVQIVWRSDLPARQPQLWADVVALCPPGSAEAMLVPLYAVRAWLAHRPAPEIADTIANVADAGPTDQELWNQTAFALRWCGEDDPRTDLVGAAEVRPGDTLIVPSEWRGADEYGWLPNASDKTLPVSDLGDRVQLEQRGRATLRICTPICGSWVPPTSQICSDLQILVRQLTRDIEEGGDPPDVDGILALLIDNQDAAGWLREAAKRLRADRRRRLDMHPAGGVVLRAASRFPYRPPGARDESEFALPSPEPDFTPEDNASSFVSRPVKLRCHSLAVEELATEFARRCGLDPGLIADLSLAARLHDIGKADPRFQRWLYGGDEVAAALYDLRAKSGMRSRRLRERAREISGYPKGGRHELLSLAMVEPEVRELGAHDTELVLHLIGSHHGLCRPFVPHIDDQDEIVTELDREFVGRALCASTSKVARLARLDSGVSERYWSLLRKFGWLGLPYLEAIFRLADHRESDIEEKLESQGASE
jgi:CRISPR-associated endonuclease/helicase Cas3